MMRYGARRWRLCFVRHFIYCARHGSGSFDFPSCLGQPSSAVSAGAIWPWRPSRPGHKDGLSRTAGRARSVSLESAGDSSLAPFTESLDVMGDGSLTLLPTPGHIAGSMSLLVRRGTRPPLLVGDLTYG
jgi:hypothetical protein